MFGKLKIRWINFKNELALRNGTINFLLESVRVTELELINKINNFQNNDDLLAALSEGKKAIKRDKNELKLQKRFKGFFGSKICNRIGKSAYRETREIEDAVLYIENYIHNINSNGSPVDLSDIIKRFMDNLDARVRMIKLCRLMDKLLMVFILILYLGSPITVVSTYNMVLFELLSFYILSGEMRLDTITHAREAEFALNKGLANIDGSSSNTISLASMPAEEPHKVGRGRLRFDFAGGFCVQGDPNKQNNRPAGLNIRSRNPEEKPKD